METRITLCQCTRCASVFEWKKRKNNKCPKCRGTYTVIRFTNPLDEKFLNEIGERFSE